jgi:hypothetical protein
MAHFARLNEENTVVRVSVLNNEVITDSDGVEQEQLGIDFLTGLHTGFWKQTSYNGNFRKNYAGTGFTYDSVRDAFIPPQPFNSWTLNEDTCLWDSPVAYPEDALMYTWDEPTTSWVEDKVE